MSIAVTDSLVFKLSLCISTFNRANVIGATLDSIISQAPQECEIVVSDNASSDGTEAVVTEYARRFKNLRYFRQSTNDGFDRNFDRVVELARGEYCWLMSDDDFLRPGAIATILEALRSSFSLILVNYERRDAAMSKVLLPRAADFMQNRVYASEDLDRLFLETVAVSIYIGSIVIERGIWLSRERQKYYGSMLIHLAVIYQARLPSQTLLVAEPFVSYRMGNTTTFWPSSFEILLIRYPSLVWSSALSDTTKRTICHPEPWKNLRTLLLCRAMGWYSFAEYERWIRSNLRFGCARSISWLIAHAPGAVVNAIYLVYYSMAIFHRNRRVKLYSLRKSDFHFRNWRIKLS